MTTAFVMTGGGSLGAIQVGMLAELLRSGVRPDFIVGVSAGAINGAFLAHEVSAGGVERLAALWSATTTREALGLSWRSVLGVLGMRGHVGDPRGLRALLARAFRARRFDQLALPFHVVCAELITGEAVVLSSGELIEAVVASAAIPGIFPPVTHGERTLVDGAIASESAVAVAHRLGADRLFVLPCGFACAASVVSRRALGRAMHAITLLGARELRHDCERFGEKVGIHVVPPLCPLGCSPYDYSQARELIERSATATREWIGAGGLERSEVPMQLAPHHH